MVGEIDHKIWIDGIESDASRTNFLEFVEILRHRCENKSLYDAWQFCGGINEWHANWPHPMKLWQNNTCHSLEYYNLCEGVFKTKCYQEPLASFIEIGHSKCFDAGIIKPDKGG